MNPLQSRKLRKPAPVRIGPALLLAAAFALAVTSSVFAGGKNSAAADLCGATITQNLKLDHDLSCSADGLTIGADGIKIDLNGHTVEGSGDLTSVGIRVFGRTEVRIKGPGEVTGFRTGVWIEGSTDVRVKKVTLSANGASTPSGPPFPLSPLGDGVHVTMSSGVRLAHNLVFGNGDDGINVHRSTQVRVVENVVHNNRHDNIRFDLADGNVVSENVAFADLPSPFFPSPTVCSIELFGSKDNRIVDNHVIGTIIGIRLGLSGSVGPTGNRISENVVEDSFTAPLAPGGAPAPGRGILLAGSSVTQNTYTENLIVGHPNGIAFSGGATGNTFRENVIAMNGCGVLGSTAGNTFEENEFRGNTVDFC
jgi:parallel beta-helix repeat protein